MSRVVLIVEDDALIACRPGRASSSRGGEVTVVDTVAGALAAVADHEPDLVLLDPGLSDRVGTDVALALVERDSGADAAGTRPGDEITRVARPQRTIMTVEAVLGEREETASTSRQ